MNTNGSIHLLRGEENHQNDSLVQLELLDFTKGYDRKDLEMGFHELKDEVVDARIIISR